MQECSEPGCATPAAFKTRTRPAWCDDHITAILRNGGLEPLEPFAKPSSYRLTRCLDCGCEAHYRLEYTLDRNANGEATCRACFWRAWARTARSMQGSAARQVPTTEQEARSHADSNGYDYLEALTSPSLPDDPHRVRCRYCGRIQAERLADIGWGCSCQVNPKRPYSASKPSVERTASLLKDSDTAAVAWWDHDHNDPTLWATARVRARRDAQWRCPDCGLRFTRRIFEMTTSASCPECSAKAQAARRSEYERLTETAVADIPELLAAWADDADPRAVELTGGPLRRFRCPAGHHPRVTPYNYFHTGCPICRGLNTRKKLRDAAATGPPRLNPEVASQWHPTRNKGARLKLVSPASRRVLWWQDPVCGHEWQACPADREKRQRLRCPECRTILDSLAYHYPKIAAEWAPTNPASAWQVRPNSQTSFLPTWVCSSDASHTWHASVASRTSGSGCPECRHAGKSNIELEHYAAAVAAFGEAASGKLITSSKFRRRNRWTVDISTRLPAGEPLAIEYDGSYWHGDKITVDTEKSLDLLAAGYLVVRLREHPLPTLPIHDDRYIEFMVYATAPDPSGVLGRVHSWAMDRST